MDDNKCPHNTPGCFGQAGDYFGFMCDPCEKDNLRAEIKRLQEENAELKRQNATMDTTLNIASKEITVLRAVVEKADALYTASRFPLESEKINCAMKAYQEARHAK